MLGSTLKTDNPPMEPTIDRKRVDPPHHFDRLKVKTSQLSVRILQQSSTSVEVLKSRLSENANRAFGTQGGGRGIEMSMDGATSFRFSPHQSCGGKKSTLFGSKFV